MGELLVLLVCWKSGPYGVPEQQGDRTGFFLSHELKHRRLFASPIGDKNSQNIASGYKIYIRRNKKKSKKVLLGCKHRHTVSSTLPSSAGSGRVGELKGDIQNMKRCERKRVVGMVHAPRLKTGLIFLQNFLNDTPAGFDTVRNCTPHFKNGKSDIITPPSFKRNGTLEMKQRR